MVTEDLRERMWRIKDLKKGGEEEYKKEIPTSYYMGKTKINKNIVCLFLLLYYRFNYYCF